MKILVLAWNDVSDTTIQNCFRKAGFSEELGDEDIEDDPFSALKQSLDKLRNRDQQLMPENVMYDDVLHVDDCVAATEAVMSDEMIIQEIREGENENENEEDECSEQVTEPEIEKPSASKVREAIETLVNFSMFSENTQIGGLVMRVSRVAEIELVASLKQKNIDDYFVSQ